MAKYEFPEMNGTGVDELVVDMAQTINIFVPMLLVFVFFVVWITGYRKQRVSTGVGDAPVWATVAGVVTSITALLLSLVPNLIDLGTLVITFLVTIIMGIWLFASKDKV